MIEHIPARFNALPMAALLILTVLPGAAAASDLPGFHKVTSGPFSPGATALDGDQLAWASPRLQGPTDLLLTNLTTKETSVLTSIVTPPGGIRLPTVAFDGEWLVWLDDRLGNLEVFSLHVASGRLDRLTRTGGEESGLTVAGGRAAWVLDDHLWLMDLQSGVDPASLTPQGFQDSDPCLAGSHLVTIRVDPAREISALVAIDLQSGRNVTLAEEATFGQKNPICSGDLVAWESVQYFDAQGAPRSIRQVRWADLATNDTHEVAKINQRNGRIVGLAQGFLAWMDVRGEQLHLIVHDLAANSTEDLGAVELAGLTQEALVVAREGSDEEWTLYARDWSASRGARSSGIPALGPASWFVLLLGLAGWRSGRAN